MKKVFAFLCLLCVSFSQSGYAAEFQDYTGSCQEYINALQKEKVNKNSVIYGGNTISQGWAREMGTVEGIVSLSNKESETIHSHPYDDIDVTPLMKIVLSECNEDPSEKLLYAVINSLESYEKVHHKA